MCKTTFSALTLSLATTLIGSTGLAQQSTPPATQQPPASSASQTPKATKPAAPKTGAAPAAKTPADPVLETQKQKSSYAVGLNIGRSMKQNEVDLDPDLIGRGIKDAINGAKPLLSDEDVNATLAVLQADARKRQQELQQKQQEEFKVAAEKNKKDGEDFLAANKDKPGVTVTASGLQYKILQAGDGPKPTATDTVLCNYRGVLIDGTEFASSTKHGSEPMSIHVGGVIKGWTEALEMMPAGSKWELYIPASLAYGEHVRPGGPIPPNAALVFDVELVSIQPKPEIKPAPTAPAAPGGAAQGAPVQPQGQTQPPQQSAPQAPAPAQPQATTPPKSQ